LRDLLIVLSTRAPIGPASKGDTLVNAPGTLIIRRSKPPAVLAGSVLSPSRRRIGLSN
jgi:hypothetical protein